MAGPWSVLGPEEIRPSCGPRRGTSTARDVGVGFAFVQEPNHAVVLVPGLRQRAGTLKVPM